MLNTPSKEIQISIPYEKVAPRVTAIKLPRHLVVAARNHNALVPWVL